MINKLRQHLSTITKEQFQKEWAEVKAMGLGGMLMKDFIRIYKHPKLMKAKKKK